jgi:hypothetical protein
MKLIYSAGPLAGGSNNKLPDCRPVDPSASSIYSPADKSIHQRRPFHQVPPVGLVPL